MKHYRCVTLAALLLTAAPAYAKEEPLTREECVANWKKFMTTISDKEANAVCQCIEDEKAKSPVSAEKGSALSGPSGLDNAGPWPAIMQNCVFPEKPLVPKEEN